MMTARPMFSCSSQNAQHDVGGHVVRQVADDVDGLRLRGPQVVQRAGTASDHGNPLHGHEVGLQNFDIVQGGVAHAHLRCQYVVEFDADDSLGAPDQQVGEHAATRPDFHHGAIRDVTQRLDDPLRR